MNRIGPTFAAECAAAGLAGLPFGWDANGVTSQDALTDPQRATLAAVLAAHVSTRTPPVDLAAYIAAGHAALRDGGVTVGGMRIKTDAESRGLIDGAYSLSQAQPEAPTDFKAASGWITADSQTIQTVALAVGRWVQACYSAYRALEEGRAAGTITTTAQVDTAYAAVTLPTS